MIDMRAALRDNVLRKAALLLCEFWRIDMKVFAVVFNYSVEFCYECGHSHERYIDTLFTTKEKAEQRLNKLLSKKENKGKVRIEEMVVGE